MKPIYLIFFFFLFVLVLRFSVADTYFNISGYYVTCYDNGHYSNQDCKAIGNHTGSMYYGHNSIAVNGHSETLLNRVLYMNITNVTLFHNSFSTCPARAPSGLNISLCLNNNYTCTKILTLPIRSGCTGSCSELQYTYPSNYSGFVMYDRIITDQLPSCDFGVNTFTDWGNLSFKYNYFSDSVYNNTFPTVNIPTLQSVYCYNHTFQHLVITPNITDLEGNTISWYNYFDQDPIQKIVIDDFSKTDYSMMANGWDFNATGCNYSSSDGYLKLYNGCNGIGIIKRLYNGTFNPPLQFYIETNLFPNTSNEYCILNWQNEKVTCLKLSTINPNNLPGGKLTDFYYWNGTGYTWFYQSSYNVQDFGLQFDINSTNDKFCIWGNSNDACEYEYSTQLYGTTNNQSGKFYMVPTYNFIWENYEPSYIRIDNIELTPKGNIPWSTYTPGDSLIYNYLEYGQKWLYIMVTDTVHSESYKTFGFPITVYGDCSLPQYNQSNVSINDVPTMDYINAIEDGPSKFNTVFYLILFGVFLFVVFNTQSLELSLIVTGLCGLAASWIISKDLVQMISSGSLVAVGIAVLIAKVF